MMGFFISNTINPPHLDAHEPFDGFWCRVMS